MSEKKYDIDIDDMHFKSYDSDLPMPDLQNMRKKPFISDPSNTLDEEVFIPMEGSDIQMIPMPFDMNSLRLKNADFGDGRGTSIFRNFMDSPALASSLNQPVPKENNSYNIQNIQEHNDLLKNDEKSSNLSSSESLKSDKIINLEDIEDVLNYIEDENPLIISTMISYNIPYPTIRILLRRIITTTFRRYFEK